jgi:hypothetical protein
MGARVSNPSLDVSTPNGHLETPATLTRTRGLAARLGFAVVTSSLLLLEIGLTRLFSGTIGYYFAFMSISVAMLGLGAGSLWVSLRKARPSQPYSSVAAGCLGLGASGALSTLLYLGFYPKMGEAGMAGQLAYLGLFTALFLPFLFGGRVVSSILDWHRQAFGTWYAIDLLGAAAGCVLAVLLLDSLPAPRAMLVVSGFAALGAALFFFSDGRRGPAAGSLIGILALSGLGLVVLRDSSLLSPRVIRNVVLPELRIDRWNDFSRVVVKRGPFYTWGLSSTYQQPREPQWDLLIEGVAGTQIQAFNGRDLSQLDFLAFDIGSLPHLLRPRGSALALGVGGGLDVLTARYFEKDPVVGVEVNPLVGEIVNQDFGDYSGRPYHLPGVTVHFENARTFVKRDRQHYDVVTVTWVDSGAATGAGAFALTENYLYTVEAFQDYLGRLKEDGVLTFMRARYSPEYDAIKGIGIAVEALHSLRIAEPEDNIVVTSVESPHFGGRELTQVMLKRTAFSSGEIAVIDEARRRLKFTDLYTPGRNGGDGAITNLIRNPDRPSVYASFAFDMEPNTDDRPFYFFLREGPGRPATHDVQILRQAMITVLVLVVAFMLPPLLVLLRRGVRGPSGIVVPSFYFGLLGLGFMLVEMKLLQQSVLVVGNPTLSLAAVLASLLLSTGLGAYWSERIKASPRGQKLRPWILAGLLGALVVAWLGSEWLAAWLTSFSLPVRAAGLVLAIAPLGLLLGCPLPLGMATLGDERRAPGMVAWCWGVNGLMGVAGTAVAIYIAIYWGLASAFLVGVVSYLGAALLFRFGLMRGERAEQAA